MRSGMLWEIWQQWRRKYSAACCAHQAQFTPLCFSVGGLTGSETSSFFKRLASGFVVMGKL